jgi:hypothetical protein
MCIEKLINDIYTNCRGELKLLVFINVTSKSWDCGLCSVYSDKPLGWMAEELCFDFQQIQGILVPRMSTWLWGLYSPMLSE